MDARNTYYSLLNRNLGLDEINEVIEFKNNCKLDNNNEYFYLANILIMDIYINEKLYSDALNVAKRNFNDLDKVLYKNIYYSLLERYIYIFINKKNFLTAYKYAQEKKEFIDINDKDSVNRWYLEMAYIQDSMNDKSKALASLMSIIENDPQPEIKGIVLNNLTKLFIDNKDTEHAKEYLDKSIAYSYEIKDDEARIYCAYLSAKLYQLEGKNRYALKLYSDIFRGKEELSDEYIGYLNEYLLLLNSINEFKEAKRLGDTFLKSIEKSRDLFLKRDFYSCYLKACINLSKDFGIEFKRLYSYLEKINLELKKNEEETQREISNDELEKELSQELNNIVNKLERIINIINYSVISATERDCLFEYAKKLEKEVAFDEAIFVIFNRSTFDAYPKFLSSFNTVSSFQYKKQRMYERELEYNDLNNTLIEKLIKGNNDLMIDFTDTKIDIIDPITKRSYLDLKVKYLYATPLVYENNLYATIIYLSHNVDLLDSSNLISLKIASRMLESKLVNLFYQESLRTKTNIMQVAIDGLQEGIYYYDPKKKNIYLSNQLAQLLNNNRHFIKEDDYIELIDKSFRKEFVSRLKSIEEGKKYSCSYKLNIGSNLVDITENGSPFFDKENNILFYIVTINKEMPVEAMIHLDRKSHLTLLDKASLEKDLAKKQNEEYCFVGIKVDKKNSGIINNLYNELIDYTYDFYLDNGVFYSIIYNTDIKIIKHLLKKIRKEQEVNVALINYPSDYSNSSDLIYIINELLKKDNSDISLLDNETLKIVNKINNINDCIKDALNNDDFEVLYSKLYNDNDYFGKFIKINVKGIENFDNVLPLIDKEQLIKLEFSALKRIDKDGLIVYPVSIFLIDYLIKEDLLDKLKLNKDFYFLINLTSEDSESLKHLKEKNINYLIDYSIIDKVKYVDLVASCGISLLNGEVDNTLTSFINDNKKMIISDDYVDNCDYIYYEGILNKLND